MPKQPAKQRIILVDDHEVVRLGLKSLLERHPQFDVIAEASSAREAIGDLSNQTLRPSGELTARFILPAADTSSRHRTTTNEAA